MMKRTLPIIIFFLVLMIAKPTSCYSQVKGSWSIGWSLGFVSKGGAFVKYYVDDGIALEVFGGGLPHFLHAGAEVSIHPLMKTSTNYRNLAVTAGYSWFGGFGSYSTSHNQGINIGGEFSFTTKQSKLFTKDVHQNFFISIGSTYVTKQKTIIHNEEEYYKMKSQSDTTQTDWNWVPFFEGGIVIYDNR